MFTPDSFRKVAGVALDSSTEVLEKALATHVRKGIAIEIAQALIVRTLVVEHSWKVNESAARVGMSASAASTAGKRGRVLFETGPDSANLVWQHVKALPEKVLTELVPVLQGMSTEADRTDYVVRLGLRKVASDRLAANATPERIEALTDSMLADGHRTPVAARDAVAGVATRLGIELPKASRPGTPESATDRKADVPTFDQAMTAALAAIAQAQEGADEEHPVALTPAQADLLDRLITDRKSVV